jgi:hypothetical protein
MQTHTHNRHTRKREREREREKEREAYSGLRENRPPSGILNLSLLTAERVDGSIDLKR